MLAALLLLVSPKFSLPLEVPVRYQLLVRFEGSLPIFGGKEGVAEVTIGTSVRGLAPDGEGRFGAVSELTDVEAKWNGAKMPFTVDNVKPFFPKTTIRYSPLGRVLATDAPDKPFAVRLPGLDVKRFPELSYLPVEFRDGEIEVGSSWKFERKFNGFPVTYAVQVTAIEGDQLRLQVQLSQQARFFEDRGRNAVEEKEGEFEVVSSLTGSGQIEFDLKRGLATQTRVEATTTDQVTETETKQTTTRKLKTRFEVKLLPN